MKHLRAELIRCLIEYFNSDNRRIEHAIMVLIHAEKLQEEFPKCDTEIVIATALLHDVGIKISEEKYGYNNGKTQEQYGPPIAEKILTQICFPSEKIEKVKQIIGNHHSPHASTTQN